jgi:hypothetical protein
LAKAIKNRQTIFNFLKLLALAVLIFFLYQRLDKFDAQQRQFSLEHPLFLAFGLVLMPINWWTEWRKWTLSLGRAGVQSEKSIVFHSFLAGMVTGMLTPNMLGNFIGRILYFDRKHRVQLTLLTLIGSMSQFAVTMVVGALAVILLHKLPFETPLGSTIYFLIALVACLFLVLYFRMEWLLKFLRKRTFVRGLLALLESNKDLRIRMLGLGIFRHLIFTLQFSCVLYAFGVEIDATSILWIWQFYFWVTLAPSLFLGKLGVRESVAVWVFAAAGISEFPVVLAAFSIWVMNLFLPTLVSLVILKRAKA